jgi:dolichol-phosphate mannosyltransferase
MPILSIVVPAYNEERSLVRCVERVLAIANAELDVEVVIVDDASSDGTLLLAEDLSRRHPQIRVLHHTVNQGKGAALHTGFREAKGEFVAVQDADLEYDPTDLKRLLGPLLAGNADVVFGSRFLSGGEHRVLYFWHSVGNRVLTLLSNMFTDLNLTDMETCYKIFRRDVLQNLELHEQRFGFEPEIVANIARRRLRIYEMGISYSGRTYEEGKKIGAKDGLRALYCIFKYNMPHTPLPIQFGGYLVVGGSCAIVNILIFLTLITTVSPGVAAPLSFVIAAALNYWLCVLFLFRQRARGGRLGELATYACVVAIAGAADLASTLMLLRAGVSPFVAKSVACGVALGFNFIGRRFLVFPERRPGEWAPAGTATRAGAVVGSSAEH